MATQASLAKGEIKRTPTQQLKAFAVQAVGALGLKGIHKTLTAEKRKKVALAEQTGKPIPKD